MNCTEGNGVHFVMADGVSAYKINVVLIMFPIGHISGRSRKHTGDIDKTTCLMSIFVCFVHSS